MMTEAHEMTAARQSSPSREQVHARLSRLKRGVVAGAVIGFASILGLVAQHSVGVTSSGQARARSAPQASAPGQSGFFGDNGGSGVGSSGGISPVLGSGGS